MIGMVVGCPMQKETKVVLVVRKKTNKKYRRSILRTKRYLVSDKTNIFQVGTRVLIKSCAPISKYKSWFIARQL
ncbi:30S ribosomal protein S17 [Candidatus Hodgkinia cicadicola]|uniref:30S ribosomal protein S17 n=1 Tax=Candidatus Hodgkinia cicadicola TaxID=573658 RepID=A0ABX4MG39_9HYPH|nr:30S ribosomal protein S17 [Candidatus Hodgkinia cicadicola]PIM95622.1 30S ribosomal protein S17 [Candidatus Hodgkinia cicadicola]